MDGHDDYKGIMTEYKLGPNGAIVTALNLFATQFADVRPFWKKEKMTTSTSSSTRRARSRPLRGVRRGS